MWNHGGGSRLTGQGGVMGPETPPHKAELLEKKTEVEPKSWREPAQRVKPRR